MGAVEIRIKLQSSAEKGKIKTNDSVSKDEMIRSILDNSELKKSYKLKLIDAYTFFKDEGYDFSHHALHQTVGRVDSGRVSDYGEILNVLKHGEIYQQPDGRKARLANGIAAIISKEGDVISIVPRKTPKGDWVLSNENNK